MHAKLRPRHRLEELLERADAARHGDERVGQVGHHRLARVHRVDDAQVGDAGVGDLAIGQRVRNHADHFAAAGEDGIGDRRPSADVAAAVDEADACVDASSGPIATAVSR